MWTQLTCRCYFQALNKRRLQDFCTTHLSSKWTILDCNPSITLSRSPIRLLRCWLLCCWALFSATPWSAISDNEGFAFVDRSLLNACVVQVCSHLGVMTESKTINIRSSQYWKRIKRSFDGHFLYCTRYTYFKLLK